MARRTEFLIEACARLGADHVTVLRGRAEESAGRDRYDVVTSRALAPLPRLLAWSLPLVAPGGVMLAMKGSSAAEEIEQSGADLARWRAEASVVVCEVPGASPTTVVRVVPGTAAAIGWTPSATTRRERRGRR